MSTTRNKTQGVKRRLYAAGDDPPPKILGCGDRAEGGRAVVELSSAGPDASTGTPRKCRGGRRMATAEAAAVTPRREEEGRAAAAADDEGDDSPDRRTTEKSSSTAARAEEASSLFFTPKKRTGADGGGGGERDGAAAAEAARARVTPSPAAAGARRGFAGKETEARQRKAEPRRPSPSPAFVPAHEHRSLGYLQRGRAELGRGAIRAYEYVSEHCDIPLDFEANHEYGPLSGTCHEERVIAAYAVGILRAKPGAGHADAAAAGVCSHCGEVGHMRAGCADLI